MNRTKIEYLDFTWNPVVGCSGIGCAVREHCWARAMAKRQKHRCELCYTFEPHIHWERLDEPLSRKKPARIGVVFMGEFWDREVPEWVRSRIFMTIEKTLWHTFVILTKQPQNIDVEEPIPKNVWLGVSVNRRQDLWRIDTLRQVPATIRTASFEPLYECMGDIDLEGINWVIIGAQTRPRLQPDSYWVWSLRNEAQNHGIPIFMKNNLSPPWPKDQRIQEFPKSEVE